MYAMILGWFTYQPRKTILVVSVLAVVMAVSLLLSAFGEGLYRQMERAVLDRGAIQPGSIGQEQGGSD